MDWATAVGGNGDHSISITDHSFRSAFALDLTDEPTTWAPKLAHTWTTTPPLDTTPIFTNLETPTYSQRAVKNLGRLLRVLVNKLGLKAWIADNMEDWRSWAAGDERGAVTIWGRQGSLANFTGQERGYNDMGPLRFTGLSQEEQRSVVLMWSLLKSPLFVAGDFDTMPKDAVKLLRHPDLIKLNRDGGRQMDALMKRGKAEVWTRAIENGILVGEFSQRVFGGVYDR